MAVNLTVTQNQTTVEVASAGVQGAPGPAGASGAGVPFPLSFTAFSNLSLQTFGAANRCFYVVNVGASRTITKIAIQVGVSSGNISVAVYSPNVVDPAIAVPSTRKVTSGAIACPATGYQEIAIASTLVNNGDFLALSCDNTTATFLGFVTGATSTNMWRGIGGLQETAHPAPTTPGTIDYNLNRAPVLKGVA
jgi:hypothetical protein